MIAHSQRIMIHHLPSQTWMMKRTQIDDDSDEENEEEEADDTDASLFLESDLPSHQAPACSAPVDRETGAWQLAVYL